MQNAHVYIGLINPKSPENVGSVMRAAGNFNIDQVFYSGSRYPRALRLNPGVMNTGRKVGQDISLNSAENIFSAAASDMRLVCVEFAENAIALPDYHHPQNAMYIFGPEDGSITQDVIDKADDVVYVPTTGCMNLAATVNVVLYDRLSKSFSLDKEQHNEMIRRNRDLNNRLKVIR